mgnify:FL=1
MAVFLTAKLKVHNPAKGKQAALDTALEQHTYAYQFLLDWSKNNLATVEEKGQRGKNILDNL